jgi:hypothetical protein
MCQHPSQELLVCVNTWFPQLLVMCQHSVLHTVSPVLLARVSVSVRRYLSEVRLRNDACTLYATFN